MKMGLRVKMLLMVVIPIIITGLSALVIGVTQMRNSLEESMEDELKAAAISGLYTYEYGHLGDYVRNIDGTVRKGETFVITGDYQIVDNLSQKANLEATFFFKDERIVTSLFDKSGNRLIGSKANSAVIDEVLNQGKMYFDKKIDINGKAYYGYYIPIKQPSTGENVGMFFTGRPCDKVNEAIRNSTSKMIVIIILVVVLTICVIFIIASAMIGAIKRAVKELGIVSRGCLTKKPNQKDLERKDEIGEIVNATEKLKKDLKDILGQIKETAVTLDKSSEDMNLTANTNYSSMKDLEKVMGELAKNAVMQADDTEDVTKHIVNMGELIEETVEDVRQLNSNAISMKQVGEEAISILEQLNQANEQTKAAIKEISVQTNTTNESAQQIKKAIAIIASITESTNLLALNARIEAARAGEWGKGFVVVATEIQKLAEQSNESTIIIEKIVSRLLYDSENAVDTMEEVKTITHLQSEKVSNTKTKFEEVKQGINTTLNYVEKIHDRTKELHSKRNAIVDIVQNLSAGVEENAASMEETSSATEEMESTIGQMKDASETLHNIGITLTKNVEVFELS